MRELRRMVYRRATAQRGLLTTAELVDLGSTASQRARLRTEGTLVPVARSVYLVGGAPFDPVTRVLAGCLEVGGVGSHRTAAWLHGLPGWPSPRSPEVLVLGRRTASRPGLARMHTTTSLPAQDQIAVKGVPVTSVARTLLGLAALVPEVPVERVRGAVDDAVRTGKASDAWLWARLESLRCRGRDGVTVTEAILRDRAGGARTESWLEREYLRLSDGAALPRPICQARIAARGAFVARVDFLYREARVAIEVTGAVAHSSPAQRAADARRRNALLTAGYLVLEFTYEQVVHEPEAVARQVRAALRARRAA